MDVKQIREEISKIDALLQSVDAEIEKIGPEPVPPREVVEAEYLTLLAALSSGGGPFASLGEEALVAPGLDAFTFFGLLQAFIDDPVVISCLAQIFAGVVGVTSTQLEDSLLTVERITDETARELILTAIVDRIVREIENGKISDAAIIAVCCQRLTGRFSQSILRLLESPGWDRWPLFVQVELCHYLLHQPVTSDVISKFIDCVINVTCGPDCLVLERAELARSPRIAFQLIDLLLAVRGNEAVSACRVAITGYVEKCLKSPHTIPGQLRQATDLHRLCVQLARVQTDPTHSVWTLMMEKLAAAGVLPLYEVPGTLTALASIRLTAENLFSNILSVKKRVASFTHPDMQELISYLVVVGDKSPGAAVTKFLLERRDLFVPAGDSEDTGLLASLVELAGIAAVESGTVLPECVLLLKKYQGQISREFDDPERFAAISQLLLPNSDLSTPLKPPSSELDSHSEQIRKCLLALGLVDDGAELITNGTVDGLVLDFLFPRHKICVVIERQSVFNVSTKRATVSGRTALKANLMAQRKSFRVIVVIPELYIDEKALILLLAEPLKKITPNATVELLPGTDLKLTVNQRMALFHSKTDSLVELSRTLYQMLKASVSTQSIRVDNLVAGDQFFNLVLSEFLPTYLVKHKGDLSVAVSKFAPSSVDTVYKLVDQLNSAGNASGGFGIVELKLGIETDLKNAVLQRWSQTHPGSSIKLADGLNGRKSDEYNIIYLS